MKGGRNSGLPWNRKMMSKSVNKLLAASSQHEVSTVTGLVRAYDGPFIRGLNLKSMGPEINTEILYKAQILRARVIEIPAHLDWTGQSERMKARKVSLKVSSTSKLLMFSSFLFRPITFFLVPGLILLAISLYSLGALAWTVVQGYGDATGSNFDARLTDAFADAWAQRPHSFIIGGITFVVAVQLVSLGVLAAQAKRYFEDLFHIESRVLRQVAQVDERLRLVESTRPRRRHDVTGRSRSMSSSTLDDSVTAPEQDAAPGTSSPAERTRSLVLIGLLTIAGAILWTWELGSKSLYRDEAFTASTVLRPWGDLLSFSIEHEANGALHAALLRFVAIFGDGEATLRSVSVLAMAALVPAVAAVAWRLLSPRVAVLAGALIVVNGSVAGYAQNARTYALSMLLATLATLFFVLDVEQPRRWTIVSFWGAGVLLAYSHIVGLLLLAALVGSLWFLPPDQRLVKRRVLGVGAHRAGVAADGVPHRHARRRHAAQRLPPRRVPGRALHDDRPRRGHRRAAHAGARPAGAADHDPGLEAGSPQS